MTLGKYLMSLQKAGIDDTLMAALAQKYRHRDGTLRQELVRQVITDPKNNMAAIVEKSSRREASHRLGHFALLDSGVLNTMRDP
jgi:hypothetical protein